MENSTTGSQFVANDDATIKDDGRVVAERVAIGIVLCVFVISAVAGNLLVIVAILTDRTLRKTSNYFLVSLALADTMVASGVMTFAVVNDVLGRWIFGPVVCKIWMSADVMCSTASILNLCAISLDRYVHIRNPLHYETWITHRRVLLAIAVIWVMSGLISFLPIQLGWHRIGYNASMSGSESDVSSETVCHLELNPLYATLSSAISFYLPCFAMIFIYYRLHLYARRHVENIRLTCKYSPASISPNRRVTTPGGVVGGANSTPVYKMSDHKAAITLGIIMGVFLLCWTPFFTINIVGAFCPACIPPLVFAVFSWLGYVNSTMNPVIYSIFNRQFREAFKRVLLFPCGKRGLEYGVPMRYFDQASGPVEYGTVNSRAENKLVGCQLHHHTSCI